MVIELWNRFAASTIFNKFFLLLCLFHAQQVVKFSINIKGSNDASELKIKGNLNILNKKINFDRIFLNEKKLPKEDLKYLKNSFENILFNESFLEIFKIKKIKNYILEII